MEGGADRPPNTFSVAQVNTLLPQVIPIVEQLQALQRSIVQTNQQLDETAAKLSAGNGYPIATLREQLEELTKHLLQLIEAFRSAQAQLETLGGALKDASLGLVDFYGLRDGEVICLCWKLGEPGVRFWHSLEAGYAGRQPIHDAPQA